MTGLSWSGLAGATALGLSIAAPAFAQDGMPSFASDAALRAFLDAEPTPVTPPPPPPPPPPLPISHHDRPIPGQPPGPAPAPVGPIQHDPPALRSPAEVVETPGVDAGDVVQPVGDHLVILRRGRLFSVSTAGEELRVVGTVDAFAPGALALRDWAEQMFVTNDIVSVIAFSAARGGREVSRFRVSPEGALSWMDTYQLLEGDAYGHAEIRAAGGRLIMVAGDGVPVFRDISGAPDAPVPPVIGPDETFVPAPLLRSGAGGDLDDVSVTRCDLSAARLACDATRVLAPKGRPELHVAHDATWVWTPRSGGGWPTDPAWLYRIPHDGGRPSAIQVSGDPVGPGAFGASRDGRRMTVVVKRRGRDETDFDLGLPTLVRIDADRLGDGSRVAPRTAYTTLPGATDTRVHESAMVDGAALYAHKNFNAFNQTDQLVAVAADASRPVVLETSRDFQRFVPAGRDVITAAAGGGLLFNVVDLDGPAGPVLGATWTQLDTAEHESRDHPIRYLADADAPDGERGLLAFPAGASRTPLDMVFVRRDGLVLSEAGRLASTRRPPADDGCRASCAAWFRDARAVSVGDRIYALLGYELVEAERGPDGRVREVRRLDFAPPRPAGTEPAQ